jgi:peptidoglycan hydrolase-like protein with peptidoglycan-binding domain
MSRRMLLAIPSLLLALAVALTTAAPIMALARDYPHTSLGNRGANVRTVQHLLRHHGASLAVTGVYDDATASAVADLQLARGLVLSGQVDTPTWTRLRVALAPGSTGEAVLALQRQLNEKRAARLALTGTYDEATTAAVRAFQRHAGLTVSGSAGPGVWRVLVAHLERPAWRDRLCDYSVGNGPANWGTAAAIGQLEAAADIVAGAGYGRVAVGDIGFEHGGDIPGHVSHEQGLDVDLRLMRRANDQCTWGGSWRMTSYDRAATRALIVAIRATAPGHVRHIYFNDPVLVAEGLVRARSGHDDHLHIRYCEVVHPVPAYDCG